MASSRKTDWEERSNRIYNKMLKELGKKRELTRSKKIAGLMKNGYSYETLMSKSLDFFPTPLSELPSAPITNPETMEFLKKSRTPKTKPRSKDQFFKDYERIFKNLIERDTEVLNKYANKYNYSTIDNIKKEKIKVALQNLIKYYRTIYYDEDLLPFNKIPHNKLKIESFNRDPDRYGHLSTNSRNYKSFFENPIGGIKNPLINPKTGNVVKLKELIEIYFNGDIFQGLSKQSYGLGKKKKSSKKSLKKSLKKPSKKVNTFRGKTPRKRGQRKKIKLL